MKIRECIGEVFLCNDATGKRHHRFAPAGNNDLVRFGVEGSEEFFY